MGAIRYLTASAGCAVLLGLAVTSGVRAHLSQLEAAVASDATSRARESAEHSGTPPAASDLCTTASDGVEHREPVAVARPAPSARRTGTKGRPVLPAVPRHVERDAFADELHRGIRKLGEGRYEIKRSAMALALGNLALLSGSVRVAPDVRAGKPFGFRLFSIAPDGPFAKLGLRDDDVLLSINRLDIATAEQALEAYGKLKTASHLVLGVMRGGHRIALEYWIR